VSLTQLVGYYIIHAGRVTPQKNKKLEFILFNYLGVVVLFDDVCLIILCGE
jgi:hypothetical protein